MKDNIKIEFSIDRTINSAHIGECIGEAHRATLKGKLEGDRRMGIKEALGVRAYLDILHNHIYELKAQANEQTAFIFEGEKNIELYNTVYQEVKENFNNNL